MRKQKQIWLHEHTSEDTLPSLAESEPSSGLVQFVDWLKQKGIAITGNAVDIGSGKGRNSVYLAEQGYEVWAMEYIEPALNVSKNLAKNRKVDNAIHFELAEIDKPWVIADNFFDIALDCFSSIDIETKEGREICRDEMFRTLKPDGYALVTVCSIEDEWEKEFLKNSPGPEPNSVVWPTNGKFQKDYDEPELREFFREFEIVELKTISKPAFKLGREGTATNFWVVLRKTQ